MRWVGVGRPERGARRGVEGVDAPATADIHRRLAGCGVDGEGWGGDKGAVAAAMHVVVQRVCADAEVPLLLAGRRVESVEGPAPVTDVHGVTGDGGGGPDCPPRRERPARP